MVRTATAEEIQNKWNDPVIEDTLFTPVTKGLLWGGFGLVALTNLVLSILTLVFWFDLTGSGTVGRSLPGSLDAIMVFAMVNGFGSVVFSSGMVCGALLVSRTPDWGRITLLCVAGLLIIGSTTINAFGLLNLFS